MKKTIILLMSIITIILIMFIIVNNSPEPIKFQYNNIYIKETYNYINNDLYSTTTETITLKNGALDYEATITYEDKSIKLKKEFYIIDTSNNPKIEEYERLLKKEGLK